MTFIGIVLFTVYTKYNVYPMASDCKPQWDKHQICADYAHPKQEEVGQQVPVYMGEFGSLEACDAAAKKASYHAKDGERVEGYTEVLCVPKTPAKVTKKEDPRCSNSGRIAVETAAARCNCADSSAGECPVHQ